MTLNDKIKRVMSERNFTPSYFADEIGVQRSSISHILSGRNRPSLEIIQKIVTRFPELTYEWLLDDTGPEPAPQPQPTPQPKYQNQRPEIAPTPRAAPAAPVQPRPARLEPVPEVAPPSTVFSTSVRSIERVLVFFSDKTFAEYGPGGF